MSEPDADGLRPGDVGYRGNSRGVSKKENIIFHNSCDTATWMVILNGGRGYPLFLTDEDDRCKLFDDPGEAMDAGNAHGLGSRRGFIVVPWEHKE